MTESINESQCEMAPLCEIELEPSHLSTTAERTRKRRFQSSSRCHDPADKPEQHEPTLSYIQLLQSNSSFRLFFLSYTASHLGEWLSYLASLAVLQEYSHDKRTISLLIILRLLPNVVLGPFGGVLADGRDRKTSMIALDLVAAVVGVLFVAASVWQSIALLYTATLLQQCIAGLYEPCRSAIVPLLVQTPEELKRATTLTGLTWSVVAAIGASLGGLLVAQWGVTACFVVDGVTYLWSAWLMARIPGSFTVVVEQEGDDNDVDGVQVPGAGSPPATVTWHLLAQQVHDMLVGGAVYVYHSFFGALVLVKASAAVVYGACDVLNVAFSEGGDPVATSTRLGILFGCVGVGCLVGPLVLDPFTDMTRPASLQVACIFSMGLVALGALLMGLCHRYFWMTCLFTAVRSSGASVLWINSSLLLQTFAAPDTLGRVTSIDYALALLAEAMSAYAAGAILDKTSLRPDELSVRLGFVGCVVTLCWVGYHLTGRGAASYTPEDSSQTENVSSTDSSVASETSHLVDYEDT